MKLLAKPIAEFTTKDFDELEQYIRSSIYTEQKNRAWKANSEERDKLREKNYASAQRQKEKAAIELDAIKAFVKNWIKQGSLIRLRNTKNGGWREVVRVEGNDIIGMCIYGRGRNSPPAEKIAYTGYSSSNNMNNLINYYNPDDGRWYDRKRILEIGKKY